jgi:hypothetical protein
MLGRKLTQPPMTVQFEPAILPLAFPDAVS